MGSRRLIRRMPGNNRRVKDQTHRHVFQKKYFGGRNKIRQRIKKLTNAEFKNEGITFPKEAGEFAHILSISKEDNLMKVLCQIINLPIPKNELENMELSTPLNVFRHKFNLLIHVLLDYFLSLSEQVIAKKNVIFPSQINKIMECLEIVKTGSEHNEVNWKEFLPVEQNEIQSIIVTWSKNKMKNYLFQMKGSSRKSHQIGKWEFILFIEFLSSQFTLFPQDENSIVEENRIDHVVLAPIIMLIQKVISETEITTLHEYFYCLILVDQMFRITKNNTNINKGVSKQKNALQQFYFAGEIMFCLSRLLDSYQQIFQTFLSNYTNSEEQPSKNKKKKKDAIKLIRRSCSPLKIFAKLKNAEKKYYYLFGIEFTLNIIKSFAECIYGYFSYEFLMSTLLTKVKSTSETLNTVDLNSVKCPMDRITNKIKDKMEESCITLMEKKSISKEHVSLRMERDNKVHEEIETFDPIIHEDFLPNAFKYKYKKKNETQTKLTTK